MDKMEKLKSMVTNVIDGEVENAQVNFHDYLQGAMKSIAGFEPGKAGAEEQPPAEEPDTKE